MSSNLADINNDLTPILQKPEIIGVTKKNTLSIFSSIAFAILSCLILISTFYFILKPKYVNKGRTSTKIENELDQKNFFSFKTVGRALLDDPEESRYIAPSINRSIGTRAPLVNTKSMTFQKYKSIPTNTGATEASDSTISDTAKTEDNAMVAESINIDPNFLISEGTYIPCSLTTRFVSEVAGNIGCVISKDVYSSSGNVKLIERGTKAIGVYQSGILQHGMVRMFVIWTKLITHDHKRINLVDTQVVGPLGEAGISGRVDSHFLQRFGGALMVSIVKDVLQHATQKNSKQQGSTININRYDNTKDSFTSIVEKILENSINIPPTMYKKQGDIVGILVGRDIDFSKIYKLQWFNRD